MFLAESVKGITITFEVFHKLVEKLQMELNKARVGPGGFISRDGLPIVATHVVVPDFGHLQKIIDIFYSHSEVKFVALYNDDYKELRKLIHSSVKDVYDELKDRVGKVYLPY